MKIKHLRNLTVYQIIKDSIKDFFSNQSMSLAAGTAFYTIFSLPALLIIVLNIGNTFYRESEIKAEILNQVEEMAGVESRQTLESIMDNFSADEEGVVSNVVAILILAFSAATVFVSLKNSINHIWHIKAKPQKGVLKFIINRLLGFSVVAAIGFILLVSLVLDAVLVVLVRYFDQFLENGTVYMASIGHLILTQGLLVVFFALMYKILPDAKVRWRVTWLGAFVTMVLFAAGKYIISLYMGNTHIASAYGTAGSLVVLLLWVYYSVVIFLFGAQITFYIEEKTGGRVIPNDEAVKIEWKEVED
jgi:membrane protein